MLIFSFKPSFVLADNETVEVNFTGTGEESANLSISQSQTLEENGDAEVNSNIDNVPDDLSDAENEDIEPDEGADIYVPEIHTITDRLGGDDPESNMKTFDEWKEERLKHSNGNPPLNGGTVKGTPVKTNNAKSQKVSHRSNYASLDCGAKMLSSNPQSKHASAILNVDRDLYMNSPCESSIWFIAELCEPVQIQEIHIGTFELFSSLIKEFSLYGSDRYPTKTWTLLGNFTAEDVRTPQTFMVHGQLYSKYIKFEKISHYGNEHYCPLTSLEVFGLTIESDDDDAIDESQEKRTEDESCDDEAESSRPAIISAADKVVKIVKDVADVITGNANLPNISNNKSINDVPNKVPVKESPPSSDTPTHPQTPNSHTQQDSKQDASSEPILSENIDEPAVSKNSSFEDELVFPFTEHSTSRIPKGPCFIGGIVIDDWLCEWAYCRWLYAIGVVHNASSLTPPPSEEPIEENIPYNPVVGSGATKESLLMRLKNKVKLLEVNMSLSSEYLEELSKRYKHEIDAMKVLHEKAFNEVGLANIHAEARYIEQMERMNQLSDLVSDFKVQLESCKSHKTDSDWQFFSRSHLLFLVVEAFLVFFIVLFLFSWVYRCNCKCHVVSVRSKRIRQDESTSFLTPTNLMPEDSAPPFKKKKPKPLPMKKSSHSTKRP